MKGIALHKLIPWFHKAWSNSDWDTETHLDLTIKGILIPSCLKRNSGQILSSNFKVVSWLSRYFFLIKVKPECKMQVTHPQWHLAGTNYRSLLQYPRLSASMYLPTLEHMGHLDKQAEPLGNWAHDPQLSLDPSFCQFCSLSLCSVGLSSLPERGFLCGTAALMFSECA